MGGQPRNYLASLDAGNTGTVAPWNPNPNSYVYSLVVSGATLYAGGHLSGMGGQTRNHIAALDALTGHLTPWNPDVSGSANALAIANGPRGRSP
jgi:hypothetical protein